MEIELQQFRDGDECGSRLVYAERNHQWLCSDTLGVLYSITSHDNLTTSSWERSDMVISPVSSYAVSPDGAECAVATENSVHLHSYPMVDNVEQPSAGIQIVHKNIVTHLRI